MIRKKPTRLANAVVITARSVWSSAKPMKRARAMEKTNTASDCWPTFVISFSKTAQVRAAREPWPEAMSRLPPVAGGNPAQIGQRQEVGIAQQAEVCFSRHSPVAISQVSRIRPARSMFAVLDPGEDLPGAEGRRQDQEGGGQHDQQPWRPAACRQPALHEGKAGEEQQLPAEAG